MDPEDMWVPDTIIREDASTNYLSDFKPTPVRIYNDGLTFWTRLG